MRGTSHSLRHTYTSLMFLSSPPCGGHHCFDCLYLKGYVSIQSPVRGTSTVADLADQIQKFLSSPPCGRHHTDTTGHPSTRRFYPVPRAGDIGGYRAAQKEYVGFYPVPRAGDISVPIASLSLPKFLSSPPCGGHHYGNCLLCDETGFYPVPRAGDIDALISARPLS